VTMQCHIIRQEKVTASDREAMWELHRRYFAHVTRDGFLSDMAGKDWVIVLRDDGGIGGFSTVQFLRVAVANATPVFLFSGDTVVDRAHWRSPALAGAFGHMMQRAIRTYAPDRVYWFLITKGYRTYRFLPVYFHHFIPACDRIPPPDYPVLLDAVARHKFGNGYDAQAGIVRHAGVGDCLQPMFGDIPMGRERDPHVQFFLRRNPAYRQGDELACLAEIAEANFNRLAWRVIRATEVRWEE
jgi:hypothetical protein